MHVCGRSYCKWTVYILSIILLILGILTIIFWGAIFDKILIQELSLGNSGSSGYKMWKETPIPMYISFYLFNWTNANAVTKNWKIKPIFVECGPYVYSEHHVRVNVHWNNNGTLTYQQKRIWKFLPEKSVGSLNDSIINLNVIAATVGYMVRNKHYLVRRGVNFIMEEKEKRLFVKKNASEWLFDGYEDELLHLVNKLNISGFNIPYDKFGWFYGRNESETYDGNWTIYTGKDNLNTLGVVNLWNGSPTTSFYEGTCSMCNGTSGELWPPLLGNQTVSVFASDTCSSISLKHNGSTTVHGVVGEKFIGDDSVFDNGTKYPEMSCFSPGISMPSGVRNVSQCRFGAPAFISFPHFYLADPSYVDAVVGMKPNKSKHEFSMSLEPNTGIPLTVLAQMQINILIEPIPGIDLLEPVPKVLVPMLWFSQTATLTNSYADQTKVLLVLPSVGTYTGYGFLACGIILIMCAIFITFHKGWKGTEGHHLLSHQSL